MTREEITRTVVETIGEMLEISAAEVRLEATFADDLKADSLAVVELMLALEEAFEIRISDEDTEKIRTVDDAVSCVARRLEERAAEPDATGEAAAAADEGG